MKKIILGLMVVGITMASANTVEFFKKGVDSTGGIIDKEVIYIYKDAVAGKDNGENSRKILLNMAIAKICKSNESRDLIEKAQMAIKFVYISNEGATVVYVDNCDSIKAK